MLRELKKSFDRPETLIAVTIGVAMASIGLFVSYDYFRWPTPSAFQASLFYNSTMVEFISIILLPALAIIPYSDSYFVERSTGVAMTCLTREGRMRYFLSRLNAAVLTALVVVAIPYLLNIMFSLVAYRPAGDLVHRRGTDAYGLYQTIEFDLPFTPFPGLYMGNQALLCAICFAFVCGTAAVSALAAFAFNLYFRKNRVLANLIPIGGCFVWMLLFTMLDKWDMVPNLLMSYFPQYRIENWTNSLIVIVLAAALSLGAVIVKIRFKKDEII